ncbi:MAG: SDR family oxidoreductase [Rhodospirillaceae bacterium]|jgi:NAD(P)-dependent dehydrogenase (short-subunit alcohol dehydrogenase family)|nr:SDR family oxidoreductase [Rhodospirillaceae bacterium]MBT5666196.1 SDR family oxidoreductase [Rhodospirillaceae bacterium]MBT5809036.1 SDR family oxidoreductase [Rhodospirillaceae bacterium]
MGEDIRLDGKIAVVTGGGRGLGRAMALALVEAGANVIAADIIGENLDQVAGEAAALANPGANTGALAGVTADIRQSGDCRRVVEAAHAHFGGLDILINNAGLLPSYAYPGRFLDGAEPAKFWNLSDDVVQDVLDTNFVAHDRLTRYAVPHMIDKGWGRIVNVTTRLTTMNRTGGSPYGASKAALEMASEIWLKDLDGTGVTVNILNPGAAGDTPGFATPEEKRIATASGRLHMMHPDKMRAPAVWLVSNATDGVNGMRYDAVSWDASRPAAEQAAQHGRPLGFVLKPKAEGDGNEVRDDKPVTGTQAAYQAHG